MKTVYLTVLSILAFAGNSVLCRMALVGDQIDPMSFSAIRLFSGAITLLVLIVLLNRPNTPVAIADWRLRPQHLLGAGSLLSYAVLFSFAYIELSTGIGALLLFTSVQVCMLLWALINREQISAIKWLGSSLAIVGLVVLLAPDSISLVSDKGSEQEAFSTQTTWQYSLMMIASGFAWGVYTINGRSSRNPLRDTTLNFCLSLPLIFIAWWLYQASIMMNINGFILACLSGAVTSAMGYAIWYAVLPKLSTPVAASAQLMAPLVAALAGALLVQEAISWQFLLAFALVSTGILLTVLTFKQPSE